MTRTPFNFRGNDEDICEPNNEEQVVSTDAWFDYKIGPKFVNEILEVDIHNLKFKMNKGNSRFNKISTHYKKTLFWLS